ASDQPMPEKFRQAGMKEKEISSLISGLKRTARQIERTLVGGKSAETNEADMIDAMRDNLKLARQDKANLLKELRAKNLVGSVEARLGRKLARPGVRKSRQAAVSGMS